MKLVEEATEQYRLKISPGGRIEGSEDLKIEPTEEIKLELDSSSESGAQSGGKGPIPEPGNGTSQPGVVADPWSMFFQRTNQTPSGGDDVTRGGGQIRDSTSSDQQNEMETSQQNEVETSQQNEMETSQQNEVETSQQNEMETSQQNEVETSRQNEAETSQQNEVETSHVGPRPAWNWNIEAPVFHSSLPHPPSIL